MASNERTALETVNAGFDAIFEQQGLEAKSYILQGRQYHGVVAGRETHIYLNPVSSSNTVYLSPGPGPNKINLPRSYVGHDLSIYLASPLKTRLQLTKASAVNDWLIRRMGLENVPVLELTLAELHLSALDVPWAQELFAQNQEMLTGLATPEKGCGMTSVMIYPEAVNLNLRCWWSSIDAKTVATWLNALDSLANSAEQLPVTSQPVRETKKELNMRLRNNSQIAQGGVIVIGILLIVVALFVLLAYLWG